MSPCAVCGHPRPVPVRRLRVADLVWLWERQGISVARLFGRRAWLTAFNCPRCGLGMLRPPIPGDPAFYEALGERPWYYSHGGKSELAFAAAFVRPGDAVLDIGAGAGRLRASLPAPGLRYVGLDPSQRAVALARAVGADVRPQTLTEHLAERPEPYDVVVALQVLEHLAEPRAVVAGALAALRPGGHLVLAVPNRDSALSVAQNHPLDLPPHHLLAWRRSSLAWLATTFGLRVVAWHAPPWSSHHRPWARGLVLAAGGRRLLGRRYTPLSRHPADRAVNWLAFRLARGLDGLPGLPLPAGPGHTLAVALRRGP